MVGTPSSPDTTIPTHRIRAVPGTPILKNTPPFPVFPGRAFSVEVPMSATPAARDSGYLAIIFLNAQGREERREIIPLLPSEVPLAEARTDGEGRFVTSLPQPVTAGEAEIHAVYPGNDRLRAVAAVAQ